MASIPLPALYLRPPQQPENPVSQMGQLVQLRSLLNAAPLQQQILQQQAQRGQLENQQMQMQVQSQRRLNDLFSNRQQAGAGGGPAASSTGNGSPSNEDSDTYDPRVGGLPAAPQPDVPSGSGRDAAGGSAAQSSRSFSGLQAPSGPRPPANASLPGQAQQYNFPSEEEILQAAGPYGLPLVNSMTELKKTKAALQEAQDKHQAAVQDYFGSVGAAIKQSRYDPDATRTLLQDAARIYPDQAAALWGQVQQNPAMLPQLADRAIAMSPKQRELATQEMAAKARQTAAKYKIVDGTLIDVSGAVPKPAAIGELDPVALNGLVDRTVPPTGETAALNSRLKSQVNFYVQQGNLEQATRVISGAGEQPGPSPQAPAQILMRAPNGETMPVPADHVGYYKSLGATVIEDQH